MYKVQKFLEYFGLNIGFRPFGFSGKYCEKLYTLPRDVKVIFSWYWFDRYYIIYKFKE